MLPAPSPLNRRHWLRRAGLLTAGAAATTAGWAQPGKPAASSRSLTVAQLVDFSEAQQDVSKDFLIGSRAAWQDINARGGIRGRPVAHLALETDGTAASVRSALNEAMNNPSCLVLSGSVGDPLASQVAALSRQDGLNIAHAAPWLQNSSLEVDSKTFPIFAARQEQIAHALKNLSVMGVKVLGAVYASAREHAAYHLEVERIAAGMQLQLQSFQGTGDVRLLGQKLTTGTPSVLLFVGGTPELAQFTQGLEKQARQRYIVALADVNLQTLLQMGAARNTPIIATQPVPMVSAALPVVRQYRETLARLFDEPPTPLSLAGFIAARYTFEVLGGIDAPLSRQSVLAGFQQRTSLNLGGFHIAFDARHRSGTYVTQSMMTLDGRLIG
ncbi:ABC transporter substrate-binding protein [Polaromonas naphthalenivorans]|uniref:Amino acid/amide ABC transporter substrate-binding protein, HAAT family n=1 Tax=Polaromonas naphthalenivorans (strain CJ2) TaxID=365044 RepID=A1VPD8_POLNA|nr:ABC transporter substrate-binding protein [Polaromonas naphthalenivorans]ABM37516.1 amino acid/amide ABC transporter substrate-binding protein, HAAT family [Polaromonas naphthalenivorans CJ2]